ncbi:nicotinamidase-related amidase [Jatrophihabitans sp. GAS493]|uniref:cysteine hydrolase family protein n=1 Tax=Jatrophihabitans sp. GAS493 TaxID=1907575 RepID=UPI000BB8BD06|nr:cysteine hydrolase [Jatrophihabitans sp. GAS493]SOD74882.1 nicotinamidase-related amidase [Jatrophihabitans sp. GAS493]
MTAPRDLLLTAEEKLDPRHTAVIVIDMQQEFTLPGFFSDRIGQNISDAAGVASRLGDLLTAARDAGVMVAHVHADYAPQHMSGPMWERLVRHGREPYCQHGTQGFEPYPGFEPLPGEPVVIKHRFDAFFETDLHAILQAREIRTVVITGVATHVCVDSTARHAYFLDYYVVFGEDLTGGADAETTAATLATMRQCFGVCATGGEIAEVWKSSPNKTKTKE